MMLAQCVAKTENGKRTVAGVCWDYDCYGAFVWAWAFTSCMLLSLPVLPLQS